MKMILTGAALLVAALFAGCVSNANEKIFDSSSSQTKLRSFQSRAFDTTDTEKTLRTVIATLQDLGFVIDKADATLGSVSGTKLAGYQVRMTVLVRAHGQKQLLVRANAQFSDPRRGIEGKAIEDPAPYQDFFTALQKSMFLTAQQVD